MIKNKKIKFSNLVHILYFVTKKIKNTRRIEKI